MSEQYLLITGRVASGKTELLIAYANMHPDSTLFLSEESVESALKQERGLANQVKVINSENFKSNNLSGYQTLCVDYLELLSKETMLELIKIIEHNTIRVILTSQVKRGNNELIERIGKLINRCS